MRVELTCKKATGVEKPTDQHTWPLYRVTKDILSTIVGVTGALRWQKSDPVLNLDVYRIESPVLLWTLLGTKIPKRSLLSREEQDRKICLENLIALLMVDKHSCMWWEIHIFHDQEDADHVTALMGRHEEELGEILDEIDENPLRECLPEGTSYVDINTFEPLTEEEVREIEQEEAEEIQSSEDYEVESFSEFYCDVDVLKELVESDRETLVPEFTPSEIGELLSVI